MLTGFIERSHGLKGLKYDRECQRSCRCIPQNINVNINVDINQITITRNSIVCDRCQRRSTDFILQK